MRPQTPARGGKGSGVEGGVNDCTGCHEVRSAGQTSVGVAAGAGRSVGQLAGLLLVVLGLAALGGLVASIAEAEDEGARIDAPADGARVSGIVEVRGRATGPDVGRFSFYRVLLGIGRDPSALRPLGQPSDTPVEDGLLTVWDTSTYPAGEYRLGLAVYDRDGTVARASVAVTVDLKPTPTPFRPDLALTPVPDIAIDRPAQAPPPPVDPGPALNPAIPAEGPPIAPRPLAPIPQVGPSGVPPGISTPEPLPGDPVQIDPILVDLVPID